MTMNIGDIQQKVVSEISRLPGRRQMAGETIMVCCPFHDDSSPSAGVFVGVGMSIPLGYLHCLGCGTKGHWNQWAPKAGLEEIPDWQIKAASDLVVHGKSSVQEENGTYRRFSTVREMMRAVGRPSYLQWPEDVSWRGYNGKILSDLGALLQMPPNADLPVCFLPVKIRKSYVGGVAGYLEKMEGRTSYLTTRGSWVRDTGLLGFDMTAKLIRQKGLPFVTIEEGPRDMLRMLSEGVPAIAALGANTWSPKKTKLIESLGVEYVYAFTDNDKGGKKLRTEFKASFAESTVKSRTIRLPEDKDKKGKLIKMDPDNAPQELMEEILDFLQEKHGKKSLFNPFKLGWVRE